MWIIKRHPCHLLENCCNMLVLWDDTLVLWLTLVIINIQPYYVHCSPWDMVPLCSTLSAQWHGTFPSRRKKEKKRNHLWKYLPITWKQETRFIAVTPGKFCWTSCCWWNVVEAGKGAGEALSLMAPLLRARVWLLLFICLQLERACKFQLLS